MRSAAFAIAVLLISSFCSATTIVILVSPTQIVMGAGSKRIRMHKNGSKTPAEPACKIHKESTFYWAASGMDDPPEFDVGDLVRKVDRPPSVSLADRVATFITETRTALEGRLWDGEALAVSFVLSSRKAHNISES
jgi:hypothetical protein